MNTDLYEEITAYLIANQNQFYRLAYSYVQNQEDALDVVQNAVCRALEHYEELKKREAMRTWFYRILVNESFQLLRKRKQFLWQDEEEIAQIPYEEKAFEGTTDVYTCINQLAPELQTIIKLRFYEEMTLREIAQVTGRNLNTVKAKLYRGLKCLKGMIQEVDR